MLLAVLAEGLFYFYSPQLHIIKLKIKAWIGAYLLNPVFIF